MTARRAPSPASLPSANMIRDDAIAQLGHEAVKGGAIVAVIIYEAADGRIVIRGHDGSRCSAKGLVREAAIMEGILDE